MKHSNFYYNDIYLGTLYENGRFDYLLTSNRSEEMNVETIVHVLEVIRQVGLDDNFNYDNFLENWNEFPFQDGFEFK